MTHWLGFPVVMGSRGVVATASPLATVAGLDMLMEGGNAIDAAVAAAAVLSVDEPHFSGIGGHGALMLRLAHGGVRCLDFGGFLPHAFTIDQLGEPPLHDETSARSTVFPGTLAGWAEALERHGTRSLGQCLEPAIEAARRGVPVRPAVVEFIGDVRDRMAAFPELAKVHLPDGRVPRPGECIANPDLADTYERIASAGSEEFYQGEIADRIITFLNASGSRFSPREFREYRPRWRETIETTYRGLRVVAPKAQTCAATILTQLNLRERFDIAGMGRLSTAGLHIGIESAKFAYSDRRTRCGDPDFSDIPYDLLASKAYAAELAARIDPTCAAAEPGAGPAIDRGGGTTHLSVIDHAGNAVAMTLTLGPSFGSMRIVPGTGIILNNEGVFFDLEPPGAPNFPGAGKLVQHDMSPVLAFRNDALFLAIGTPGAQGITQTIPQVISHIVDHELPLQEAIAVGRYRYYGNGAVRLGADVGSPTRERLRELGHRILSDDAPPIWAGGFHAAMVDPDTGALIGGADPRRGGLAAAY